VSGKFRLLVDRVRSGFSDNPARMINLARILLAFSSCAVIGFISPSAMTLGHGVFEMLVGYSLFAVATAGAGARSWWAEAKLAPLNYLVDSGMFLAMLLLTHSYESMFLTFFLLLLVSSPSRIGWGRAVAVGLALGLLLVLINVLRVLAPGIDTVDLDHLILRLVSLAMLTLLIAFFYGEPGGEIQLAGWQESLLREVMREGELPLSLILGRIQSLFGADRMAYVWRDKTTARLRMVLYEHEEPSERSCTAEEYSLLRETGIDRNESFLFDGLRGRVLSVHADGRKVPLQVKPFAAVLDPPLTEGVCIPIDCQAAIGRLFVVREKGVSEGDLRRAEAAGNAMNAALDRYHLVDAIRDSAFSKARLAMARNIHDSVLQSLAGLGMRFGAMKLDLKAGRVDETIDDLDKLQSLVKEEQLGLRALMREDQDAAEESCNVIPILRELASALAQQWRIECAVSAFPDPIMIPVRLGTEVRFLVREAVANAAKHARATWVRVSVAVEDDAIKLVITSDRNGEDAVAPASPSREPRSLSERVEGLGGSVMLKQKATGTHLTAFLPRRGR
jgi:signal transduction histidine kinase